MAEKRTVLRPRTKVTKENVYLIMIDWTCVPAFCVSFYVSLDKTILYEFSQVYPDNRGDPIRT